MCNPNPSAAQFFRLSHVLLDWAEGRRVALEYHAQVSPREHRQNLVPRVARNAFLHPLDMNPPAPLPRVVSRHQRETAPLQYFGGRLSHRA